MDIGGLFERLERIVAARSVADTSTAELESALTAGSELRSWLAASDAEIARRLAERVPYPEERIAHRTRRSLAAAARIAERSRTLAAMPQFAAALNAGMVTAAHVDVVTRAAKQLPETKRKRLLGRVDPLVGVAVAATVSQFQRRVRAEVRALQDDDGIERLEQQRSAARLRTWVDDDGMWCCNGRFDPVAGVQLASRLDAELEALFAEAKPPGCPDDPVEKQHFLRALALQRLLLGSGTSGVAGRPEFVAVIDADAGSPESGVGEAAGPSIDWGLPIEVPLRVLAELADTADRHAVVVRNGVVLHAPGQLDLGRATRLANRAQRRALRALYSTCCVPGCRVSFDRCSIHHIRWWRNGGRTDLANLIPICSRHHSKVHNDGWILELGPGRHLTLKLPDGSVLSRGPTRRAAA